MILVLSEPEDISTTKVLKWIAHLGQPFLRINEGESQFLSDLQVGEKEGSSLIYQGNKINLKSIQAFWYRRGRLNISSGKELDKDSPLIKALDYHLKFELKIVEAYWGELLAKKKSIGNFKKGSLNKLLVLRAAVDCGFKIPETLATGQKDKLRDFLKDYPLLICKPIFESPVLQESFGRIHVFTEKMDLDLLDRLEDTFFPSLFQELIEKKYEIRVFYLDGKCYANAIFSQLHEKTTVDFRISLNGVPNRRVPFQLPETIRTKIVKLMERLELKSGSVDLIVSTKGDFIFLEINPVGQFGMTSFCGNYHLEKEIAEYLCTA